MPQGDLKLFSYADFNLDDILPCAGWSPARGKGASPCKRIFLKGLILAQNERWRRGLGMQVERIPAAVAIPWLGKVAKGAVRRG